MLCGNSCSPSRKLIFQAAKSGDAVLLDEVLQESKSEEIISILGVAHFKEVTARPGSGQCFQTTPLVVAVESGNLDCVKVLLKYKAEINGRGDFLPERCCTPLFVAAACGNTDCLRLLVENGADVNAATSFSSTPLMVATEKEHVDAVQFLLSQGADVKLKDLMGYTALHFASEQSSMYDALSSLIENGADINAASVDLVTPLMLACVNLNKDIAKYLVKCGANVGLKDIDGETALFHDINRDLNDDPMKSTIMFDILSLLIQNGADVNTRRHDHCTPLMIASSQGDLNKVKFFLEQGADVDLQDRNGDTALHYAASKKTSGTSETLCALLAAGASHLHNTSGLTPLLMASNSRNVEVVKFLIKQPEITKDQRINALELLGASILSYTIGRQLGHDLDVEKGFEFIRQGMAERLVNPSNPIEAYQYRKECQALEEFAQFEGDRNAQLMESLIIRERILGADNVELAVPIVECVAFYFENNDFSTCLGLYRHALKIAQSCNQSAIVNVLKALTWLLYKRVYDLPKEKIFLELLDHTIHAHTDVIMHMELREEDQELLFESSKHLVMFISKFKDGEEAKLSSTSTFLKSVCFLRWNNRTLLLQFVLDHAFTSSISYVDPVRVLLKAGCNVNAVNNNGDTPLHLAVTFKLRDDCEIHHVTDMLKVLLDGGAHHDFVNNDGKTPMDMACTEEARVILFERGKLELRCICAKAIKKFDIPYLGLVPVMLEKFISMH